MTDELPKHLLNKIYCRIIGLGQVTPVAIATYLDPRFKKMYISPDDLLQVENKIANEIDLALLAAESRSDDTSTTTVSTMQSYQNQASLWGSHDEVLIVNAGHASTAAEYIMALQTFNREPTFPKETCPIKWWKYPAMRSQKHMYEVAMKSMSRSATSVPSERVFTKTGQIITERRNRHAHVFELPAVCFCLPEPE